MSTKYVRVVPSSDSAGPPLSSEIAQAFEQVRERAYAIYDNRSPDAGSDYEDWLRAERELFEIPEIEVKVDELGQLCRVLISAEATADRPLSIAVEPAAVTIVGKTTDGLINLFRRVNLSEPIDPAQIRVSRRDGYVELALGKADVAEVQKPKAMAAAATSSPHVVAA